MSYIATGRTHKHEYETKQDYFWDHGHAGRWHGKTLPHRHGFSGEKTVLVYGPADPAEAGRVEESAGA